MSQMRTSSGRRDKAMTLHSGGAMWSDTSFHPCRRLRLGTYLTRRGRGDKRSQRLRAQCCPRLPVMLLGFLAFTTPFAGGQDPAGFFQQNCASCHTIGGGRLVGPDLKGVTKRRDRDWLVQFIVNPKAMIDRGDPHARQLLEEARGVVMPTVPGITRERAERLLDLIATESKAETSRFAGLQVSDRPFTSEDIKLGYELFAGLRPLAGGGPACIACHTVRGLGGLGGGRLGPDLTKVYERIGGRRPLAAWLVGPATTTMRPVFMNQPLQSEEILPLVAYFENAAQQPGEDDSVAPLNLFLIGLGGAIFLLAGFDGLWRQRFRAVRRYLTGEATKGLRK